MQNKTMFSTFVLIFGLSLIANVVVGAVAANTGIKQDVPVIDKVTNALTSAKSADPPDVDHRLRRSDNSGNQQRELFDRSQQFLLDKDGKPVMSPRFGSDSFAINPWARIASNARLNSSGPLGNRLTFGNYGDKLSERFYMDPNNFGREEISAGFNEKSDPLNTPSGLAKVMLSGNSQIENPGGPKPDNLALSTPNFIKQLKETPLLRNELAVGLSSGQIKNEGTGSQTKGNTLGSLPKPLGGNSTFLNNMGSRTQLGSPNGIVGGQGWPTGQHPAIGPIGSPLYTGHPGSGLQQINTQGRPHTDQGPPRDLAETPGGQSNMQAWLASQSMMLSNDKKNTDLEKGPAQPDQPLQRQNNGQGWQQDVTEASTQVKRPLQPHYQEEKESPQYSATDSRTQLSKAFAGIPFLVLYVSQHRL